MLLAIFAVMIMLTAGGCGSPQTMMGSVAQAITPTAAPNKTLSVTPAPSLTPAPSFTPTPSPTPTPLPPVLLTGKTELRQGDILSLRLLKVQEGVKPEAETELGMSEFVSVEGGEWFAVIPVGNTCEPGGYTVSIQAGQANFTVNVTVVEFKFDRQNLIIDTSSPAIAEAASPEAQQQFSDKVPPVLRMFDKTRYWSSPFKPPLTGRITTNFGEIRITNNDPSTARSHKGMDIAAPLGTPVTAPNPGRVVFAEYLLNTGNTILIEHGGGMKSVYYHMERIDVTVDEMVETGTQLGTVGTTGYSTGPHLHYEIRIGDQAVSPQMLLEPDCGLYSADKSVPNIRVFVNNAELTFDELPFIENNRTLVPMRAVFEALGASVKWDGDRKTVEAQRDLITVSLTVGSTTAERRDDAKAANITMDVPPMMVGDRVFIPLRFVAESLEANVSWDEASRTVTVEG